MQSKGIILSGSTGYLGSQLSKILNPKYLLICNKNSFVDKDTVLFDVNLKEVKNITTTYSNFIIIHLATYFSKNINDNQLIEEANLSFGQKLLKFSEKINVKKFIYTNTMFSFYNDKNIRNLYYTKTKMQFSKILLNHSQSNKYLVDEIYLDNTFGGIDNRNKIIPNIVKSIISGKDSPVLNKDVYINLLYYQDVINRIIYSIENDIQDNSAFININSVNLDSIYNYLNFYREKGVDKKELLKYKSNKYTKEMPMINYYNLKLSDIEKYLVSYLNSFSN